MKSTSETNKLFDEQLEGEEIIVVSNNHIIVLRKALVIALVVFTLSVVPYSFDPFEFRLLWLALAGLLTATVVFFYSWINWHFSYFAITNLRVLQVGQKGFFKRSVSEISLEKIQNVNYSINGLQEHILHYGTVTIQTYAGDLTFTNIQKPQKFHEILTSLINSQPSSKKRPPYVKEKESSDE